METLNDHSNDRQSEHSRTIERPRNAVRRHNKSIVQTQAVIREALQLVACIAPFIKIVRGDYMEANGTKELVALRGTGSGPRR